MTEIEIRKFCVEIAAKLVPDHTTSIIEYAAKLEAYILTGYRVGKVEPKIIRQE